MSSKIVYTSFIYIFFQVAFMPLKKELCIELILMAGPGSCRKVAMAFNRKHCKHITLDNVANLGAKVYTDDSGCVYKEMVKDVL